VLSSSDFVCVVKHNVFGGTFVCCELGGGGGSTLAGVTECGNGMAWGKGGEYFGLICYCVMS
jgi:hypothetical protein